MAIPAKIPIMQMEEYHTEHIGCTQEGHQFMAFHTVYRPAYAQLTPAQRQEPLFYHHREYVVLHRFDADGNYLSTTSWYAGTLATSNHRQIEAKLQELIEALGDVVYGDVAIKPFQTQIDGITFGLLVNEKAQQVMLQPNDLLFIEPWDGEYYT